MNKKVYRIILHFLVLAILASSTGCSNLKDLKRIRATSAEMSSLRVSGLKALDAVFEVTVDNPAKEFTLSEIEGTIERNGETVGTFQAAPITVPGRAESTVTVKGKLELVPGISPLTIMYIINSSDISDFSASASFKAELGKGISKRFSFKRIPIDDIVRNFKN